MMNKDYESNYETEMGYEPTEGVSGEKAKKASVKRKPRRGGFRRAVAMVMCCALVGGLSGAAGSMIASNSSNTETGSTTSTTTILTGNSGESNGSDSTSSTVVSLSTADTSEELTAAEVYAQNVNATVGITTSITTNYFGYETTSAAAGSGFIITSDGYIVTNYHVVEDSSEITVSLYDGTTYEAELVGYDEDNDLAVLKIDATDLQTVVLGDSDALSVGDEVVAIGNPLGELTFTLTKGIVSALNRTVTLSTNVTMSLIQTDCAINSGNSGGALFNMYGEVIGITNAKYSSSSSSEASIDNIGFAIPINQVKSMIISIIENGTVEKSYIGVSVSDLTDDAAEESGLTDGALVQSVTEDSPADEAGLEAGDIITKVGDTDISGSSDLVAAIRKLAEGDEVVFTVYRDGEMLGITITIGIQVTSALPDEDSDDSSDGSSEGGTDNDQSGNSDSNSGSGFGSGSNDIFGGKSADSSDSASGAGDGDSFPFGSWGSGESGNDFGGFGEFGNSDDSDSSLGSGIDGGSTL